MKPKTTRKMLLMLSFCTAFSLSKAQIQNWIVGGNNIQSTVISGNGETSGNSTDGVTWKMGTLPGTIPTNGFLSIMHFGVDRIFVRPTSMSLGNVNYPSPTLHINYSTTNQNVGIGTSTPLSKLHVAGDVRIGADNAGIALRVNNLEAISTNGNKISWGYDFAGGNYFNKSVAIGYAPTTLPPSIPASGLLVNGKAGIGTTNPLSKLEVAGDVRIGTDANNIALRVNGQEALWTNGSYYSWGYPAWSYFNKGITVGFSGTVLAPPVGGMFIDGSVGIGMNTTPLEKLHIKGGLCVQNPTNSSTAKLFIQNNTTGGDALHIDYASASPSQSAMMVGYYHRISKVVLGNAANGKTDLEVMGDVNVFGNHNVCGIIKAKEVKVESGWCDYVYDENYQLMSLENLESYLKTNKHLPNIPAAAEVEKNGLMLADMQRRMMEKIEELSLYVIQLKKQNESLAKKIETLDRK